MPPLLKEACIETLAEALQAEKSGANRLELCADLQQDGLTPSLELLDIVLEKTNIPVRVMIRPRGGDFVYTAQELEKMAADIQSYKRRKISGFVTGVLTPDLQVDRTAMEFLAKQAAPLPITFHKAIDSSSDILEAVATLKQIPGVESILSSGGQATAMAGAAMLQQMIALAGKDLTIIAAGKVSTQNLEELHHMIGAQEYHGRRIVLI